MAERCQSVCGERVDFFFSVLQGVIYEVFIFILSAQINVDFLVSYVKALKERDD